MSAADADRWVIACDDYRSPAMTKKTAEDLLAALEKKDGLCQLPHRVESASAPAIGQTVVAQTLGAGTQVRVEVTNVDRCENGWRVWGYRAEQSSFTKRRPRRTAYPNEYFVPHASLRSEASA